MGIREMVENDLAYTLEDPAGFGFEIILTNPAGTPLTVYGQTGDIHFMVDPDTGQGVNSHIRHISVRTQTLLDAGFAEPYAVATGTPWKVKFKDINGVEREMIIEDARPDRTLGMTVCLLGDLESGS